MNRPVRASAILLFLCLAGAAAASVVARMELPDLVRNAELVFEGRVAGTEAVLNKKGTVSTAVTVEVERAFRGVAAPAAGAPVKLVFTILGGELGSQGLVLPGMPKFRAGERMILFLTAETTTGIRAPVGLAQGKFGIEIDPKTGEKKVARHLGELQLVDPSTGASTRGADAQAFDYAKLTAEIEKLVKEDGARRAKPASAPAPKDGK